MPRFLDFDDAAGVSSYVTGGVTVNFIKYGACDGVTNDRAAFAEALSDLDDAGGGTLLLPPTDIAMTMFREYPPSIEVPANVRIVGTPGATKILLSSTANGSYVSLMGTAGDNVSFEGITFRRATNCTGFLFAPGGYDGFHIRNCVIEGQTDTYSNTFHGIVLNRVGAKKNLTIRGSTFTGLSWGLLQSNEVESDVDTITVDDCSFIGNYGDDLGFNSPMATMSNVTVTNSRFIDNASDDTAAGYAVSFAHVNGAVVRDCYVENYYNEGIHIEDHSQNIIVSNNRLIKCGQTTGSDFTNLDRGSIVVTVGSSDIVISGNTIDQRPNTNTNGLHGIVLRNLTGVSLASGGAVIPPFRCTITDNIILCGDNFGGIWACDSDDTTVRGNRIVGSGAVVTGTWNDQNIRIGIRMDGARTVIADNAVSGFRYGISGPLAEDGSGNGGVSLSFPNRRALGNPGTVSGNMVSDCYLGIVAVSAGTLNISGNIMSNCERPMAVGQREFAAKQCSVSNNFANDCTYPLEVGGTLVVKRASGGSTVTTGTGKSLTVQDVLMTLPTGTTVTWSGGASMRLNAAETVAQLYTPGTTYTLTGTVYGASITDGEWGLITGLDHSSTAADNRVLVTGNADSVSNAFEYDEPLASGEATMPRLLVTSPAITLGNDVARLTYFTAKRTETVSQVVTISGNTAQVGATLCRIHIYEVDARGNVTEVAKTANTTTLWAATNTTYTTALEAPFQKKAGRRYAVALCISGASTLPSLCGNTASYITPEEHARAPRLTAYFATATPASFYEFSASFIASEKAFYTALLP